MDQAQEGDIETECGICAFASPLAGFTGILKHRYRDFQVTEVDAQGRLAQLTTLGVPPQAPQEEPMAFEALPGAESSTAAAFQQVAGANASAKLHSLLRAIVRTYLQPETVEGMDVDQQQPGSDAQPPAAENDSTSEGVGLDDASVEQGNKGTLSVVLEAVSDKNARKAIHAFFKANSKAPPLETGTVDEAAAPPPSSAPQHTAQQSTQNTAQQDTTTPAQPTLPRTGRIRIEFTPGHAQWKRAQATHAGKAVTEGEEGKTEVSRNGGVGDFVRVDEGRGNKGGGRGNAGGRNAGGRGRGGRGGFQQQQQAWEGGSDCKHVKFVLYKENMDTQAALASMARALHLGGPSGANARNVFGFAGTKDKRGLTSQFITAFKLPPARLASLNGNSWLRGLRLGNFEYCAIPLQLGHLAGNCFQLLMRSVTATTQAPDPSNTALADGSGAAATEQGSGEQVAESQRVLEQQVFDSCATLKEHGFINYFGLQRFGTAGTPTHKVGAALLQGHFSHAVDLIMGDGFVDRDLAADAAPQRQQQHNQHNQQQKAPVADARAAWLQKRDAKAALRLLPNWMVGERSLMEGISRKQKTNKHTASAAGHTRQQQPQQQEEGTEAEGSESNKRAKGNDGQPQVLQPQEQQQQAQEPQAQQQPQQTQAQAEHSLLKEEDFAAVLCALPHSLRLMYLHAWQSRLWNLAASHRVQTYGADRVVEGDLVLPRPLPASQAAQPQSRSSSGISSPEQFTAELVAMSGEGGGEDVQVLENENENKEGKAGSKNSGAVGEDRGGLARNDGAKHVHTSTSRLSAVHVVTAEDVREQRYSIRDVVLPMPGSRVQYPSHSTRDVYMAEAAKDGVDLELRSPAAHSVRTFAFETLGGDYRRVMMRPCGFEWELIRYSNPNDDSLLSTPLERLEANSRNAPDHVHDGPLPPPPPLAPERLQEMQAQQQAQQSCNALTNSDSHTRVPVRGSGPLLGLRLQFLLPSSTYATMLIRELTRQSTSRGFQSGLSGGV